MMLRVERVNRDSLMIRFGERMHPSLPAVIQSVQKRIEAEYGAAVKEMIPAYVTLMITIDTQRLSIKHVQNQLPILLKDVRTALEGDRDNWEGGRENNWEDADKATSVSSQRCIDIPVYYSSITGPDLAAIAEHGQLTTDEVIQRHCAQQYQVYAIGFLPGFAFLGKVDAQIARSRLTTPRTSVPAGSVGIADQQTGVYPCSSPGGWNIIGQTRATLLAMNPQGVPVPRLRVGSSVRFYPVSEKEFVDSGGCVDRECFV